MFRKRIMTAVVVTGLLGAAALLAQTSVAAVRGPERMLRLASIVLNLTDTQTNQIRDIINRNLTAARPLLEQAQQTHQAFREAIENGKTDTATLQPLADQAGRTASQLAMVRARAMAEIYSILTPEQREKAKKLHDQFRNHFRQNWLP